MAGYTVRSKGEDIVVRGPGHRIRITRDWMPMTDVVFDYVRERAGRLIEVMPSPGTSEIAVDTKSVASQPTIEPASASDVESTGEPEGPGLETASDSSPPADSSTSSAHIEEKKRHSSRKGRRRK